VALVGFGMGMSESSPAPEEALQSPIVQVSGKIVATGPCARLVTCNGGFLVNLINLPATYSVGDEVILKGKIFTGPTVCIFNARTVKIGKIALKKCQ